MADSILDRLVHNACRFELSGESMRKDKAVRPWAKAHRFGFINLPSLCLNRF